MLARAGLLSLAAGLASATVSVTDPSNILPASLFAADNAILADYDVTTGMATLLHELYAAYKYSDVDAAIPGHAFYSVDANDTSVLDITAGANVTASYITVLKEGYSSNLNQASFFGVNAAINVNNVSSLTVDHINVTVHNGAANFYAYGEGSLITVDEAWLYSSGPVSHGLYASHYGTIVASNLKHFSGGNRASSFSGDAGGGYITVTDAVCHTAGIGSAIAFVLGEITLNNVVGVANVSPAMFMDSDQVANFNNVDLTAGLLGGLFMFSSSTRPTIPANISFVDSKLTTTKAIPALWAGNTYAHVTLDNAILTTHSGEAGILAVANFSQTTQDFDFYAGYDANPSMEPAYLYVDVSESTLKGDLVAYNGSLISWTLGNYSSWTGTAYAGDDLVAVTLDVALDATSNWTLTADTVLSSFVDADTTFSNIISNGYSIYYNAEDVANNYLSSKTLTLTGGGKVVPK